MHVSRIRQKLFKPKCFLYAMASGNVLHLHHREYNGWSFFGFPLKISKANKSHVHNDGL